MRNYLADKREPIPRWLLHHQKGITPDFREVVSSRVVYYPGSGNDGNPVHLFAGTHSAHVFFYVDYMLGEDRLDEQLDETGFLGYSKLDSIHYTPREMTWNKSWNPTEEADLMQITNRKMLFPPAKPYCRLDIFQRDKDRTEEHGAERFAIFFLAGDGFASYAAIFGNGNAPVPWALVLQDHGFGGNHDKFAHGGLLEKIAQEKSACPEYLLVADGTDAWQCYKRIPGLQKERGGMHRIPRTLYTRTSDFPHRYLRGRDLYPEQ